MVVAAVRERNPFTLWLAAGTQLGDVTVLSLDEELVRVEHTDLWVPRSFTARIDRADSPTVDLEIQYEQHERFRCKSVRVIARDGEAVDGDALRRVRVAELVSVARERVSYREVELADGQMVDLARQWHRSYADPAPDKFDQIQVGDLFRFPLALAFIETNRADYETGFGKKVRRLLAGADHSRPKAVPHLWVALEYDRAMKEGEPTGAAVADRFEWSLAQATNAIARARKAGYLPPTDRGQPRTFPSADNET